MVGSPYADAVKKSLQQKNSKAVVAPREAVVAPREGVVAPREGLRKNVWEQIKDRVIPKKVPKMPGQADLDYRGRIFKDPKALAERRVRQNEAKARYLARKTPEEKEVMRKKALAFRKEKRYVILVILSLTLFKLISYPSNICVNVILKLSEYLCLIATQALR